MRKKKFIIYGGFTISRYIKEGRKWNVMIPWVNGQKYGNLLQFNASRLASLETWYYFRLCFSFSCSGYDLTLIKKSHTRNCYLFSQKFLLKTKTYKLLLVTVVAQFTAKTANSEKAIYLLSLISCSINKLVSNVIHMLKLYVFQFYVEKNNLLQEMVGEGGGWSPPSSLSLWPCIVRLVFYIKLLQKKNQWIKNVVMIRICCLKKKHVVRKELQKLFTRLFIRKKDVEYTSHVLKLFFLIDIPRKSSIDIPPDDRLKEIGWAFSNDGKYIIKWSEGPAALRVFRCGNVWRYKNFNRKCYWRYFKFTFWVFLSYFEVILTSLLH